MLGVEELVSVPTPFLVAWMLSSLPETLNPRWSVDAKNEGLAMGG